MSFSTSLKGFPFLLRFAGLKFPSKLQILPFYIPSNISKKKKYKANLYFNFKEIVSIEAISKEAKYKDKKIILLVHGMSAFGISDTRIKELASNLALEGHIVITPELEEVTNLEITDSTVENIFDLYKSLLNLFPDKLITYFSVSFSAGIGFSALSGTSIPAMMLVGSFYNILNTCEFVVEHFEKDDYGTFILLYNNYDKIEKKSTKLKEIFFESALDNGLYRKGTKEEKSPLLFAKLNKKEKEIYEKIKNSKEFRKKLALEIVNVSGKLSKNISPEFYIDKNRSICSILHGKNDFVIPESESIKFSEELKKKNMEYNLEITSLLDHGDKVSYWNKIDELPSLANSFGYFFNVLQLKRNYR